MHPFVSVIVVTYNAAAVIADCLRSVERAGTHAGVRWETIVVDNASTDGTAAIVRQLGDGHLICHAENRGFAAGVNAGAQVARGDWLLVLNPDCELDAQALAAFCTFIQSPAAHHPPVAVVGFQLLHPDGQLQPSGRRFPTTGEFVLAALGWHRVVNARWFAGRDFTRVQDVDEVSGAAFAVRRDAFAQVGGMDDGFFLFFEELDLCRRLKSAGWRIVYLPTAKVRHRWGASVSQVPALARLAQQHSALRYFRKHHGCAAAMAVRMALLLQQFARFLRRPQRWHLISFALLLSPQKPFAVWRTRLCG
ncbi:N-acetylglucosaminyl-diphospho-decaprenol L-rhamnosyltransferase [bacterium HR17]|uniref:N-acetylglucosaminyl-diphospho-decaprenol L-rhamnosyltransferase n=1 Tax=Candidatus Fervidibacter japonicus TaxID=2035412 RepID=A0A2H5XES1_9BACT|nr:N-acetylglucosaminyl-diphospho-decaprenol L-rhamnosyltransferase [bacterium HR17]